MALHPSVRPSVTSQSSIETAKRIELVFGTKAYPTLVWKGIRVSPKYRCFPPELCPTLWTWKNYATTRPPRWTLGG